MQKSVWFLLLLSTTGGAAPASDLIRESINAHRAVRARVGLAPLDWSTRLAALSQDWANTLLARSHIGHRPDSPYGENVFAGSGTTMSPAAVVNAWATEARNYDYRTNRCRGVCGHYTQIVWRGTKEVGCAVARGGGREIWVCNYSPAGNWMGERPY